MTTATEKKSVNRGYLAKMAAAGRLYVKCAFHYTDDYAFDNATGFGKAEEFSKVFVRGEFTSPLENEINELFAASHPAMPESKTLENLQSELRRQQFDFRAAEDATAIGCIKMSLHDFKCKSGSCDGTKENGTFRIHSNLVYRYEVR